MKDSFKKVGAFAFTAMVGLSLVGCANNAANEGSTPGATPAATAALPGSSTELKKVDYTKAAYEDLKEGGTITLPMGEISDQQNPFHQDGTTYTSYIWEMYNPQVILFDDEFKPYANPDYVTDVKAEEKDGKTVVTYTINPKATFNDGTPIDWTAFETTWKINNGKTKDYAPNSTDGYQDIESVTKGENDKQAVVTFDKVYAWYYGLFNHIAHPKLADPEFYKTGYVKQLHPELGAGPYTVDNFDPNTGVASFVKNDKWWGKPGKLDKFTYVQMEPNAQLNAIKNGEIDGITFLSGVNTKDRYDAVKDLPGMKIYTSAENSNSVLMLNANSEALKDPRVRQAIFEARDREQLSKIAYNGMNYDAPAAGSFLLFNNQEGYHDNFAEAVKYDPENAKKLLDEAGWVPGEDGIRVKDGKRLELNYPLFGDNQVVKAQYLAFQQMLKGIGVDLIIKELPSKEFSAVYTKRNFDIMSLRFSSTDPFGVAYFGQIYGSDSGLNLSSTGTPEFDKKIADLQKIGDPKAQIEAANKLEVEAFKLYGIMPGSVGPARSVFKDGLANIGSTSLSKQPIENVGWLK